MSAEFTITTMSAVPPSPSVEAAVLLSVHVAGENSPPITPVGTVVFYEIVYDIQVPLASALTLDGSGNASISLYFTAGVHVVLAVYTPNDENDFQPSSSANLIITCTGLGVSFGIVPGFALVAFLSTEDDSALPPQLVMQAVPPVLSTAIQTGPTPQTITLIWSTFNVPQVQIRAGLTNLTGIEPTGSSGSFVPPVITATTTYTIYAYDANGSPLIVNSSQLQYSLTVEVL